MPVLSRSSAHPPLPFPAPLLVTDDSGAGWLYIAIGDDMNHVLTIVTP